MKTITTNDTNFTNYEYNIVGCRQVDVMIKEKSSWKVMLTLTLFGIKKHFLPEINDTSNAYFFLLDSNIKWCQSKKSVLFGFIWSIYK
jgi:hypothetical protein